MQNNVQTYMRAYTVFILNRNKLLFLFLYLLTLFFLLLKKEVSVPDAQLPLATPPFAAHSLVVKQVPIMVFVAVDICKMHSLAIKKQYSYFFIKK